MVYLAIFLIIVALDIGTKLWAIDALKNAPGVKLWDGVFHLTYVENTGAAFGVFKNGRVFFIISTIVVLVVVAIIARKYRAKSKILDFGLALVASGAIGNLLDRVIRGFVVDLFDFCLIDFPVFNVADISVCIGAALIAVFIIFFEDTLKEKKDCVDDES